MCLALRDTPTVSHGMRHNGELREGSRQNVGGMACQTSVYYLWAWPVRVYICIFGVVSDKLEHQSTGKKVASPSSIIM